MRVCLHSWSRTSPELLAHITQGRFWHITSNVEHFFDTCDGAKQKPASALLALQQVGISMFQANITCVVWKKHTCNVVKCTLKIHSSRLKAGQNKTSWEMEFVATPFRNQLVDCQVKDESYVSLSKSRDCVIALWYVPIQHCRHYPMALRSHTITCVACLIIV